MLKAAHLVLDTDRSLVPTVARVALGSVMFAHGAQKALGWFGGYGFDGTMGFLTQAVGLPAIVAFLVIAIEFVGAAALLVGAAGRLAALGTAAVMVGAVVTSHLSHGFFMNWSGAQAGEGFEFHILAVALAAVVFIAGSGAYSVDAWLSKRLGQADGREGGGDRAESDRSVRSYGHANASGHGRARLPGAHGLRKRSSVR